MSEFSEFFAGGGPLLYETGRCTRDVEPGYESLHRVLMDALDQAQRGKGKERHANDLPFDQQPLMVETRKFGLGGPLFQASKKTQEAAGLPSADRMIAELRGAINYLAAAILFLEEQRGPVADP